VILGPNGSGKTTLLSLAAGRRQPSAGVVRILGEELGPVDVRHLRRRIGHVSHAVADRIRPALAVEDVVLTGKASVLETWWQDLTEADRKRARASLEDVGCLGLADRPLGSCSSGERQRVLIARALFGAHPVVVVRRAGRGARPTRARTAPRCDDVGCYGTGRTDDRARDASSGRDPLHRHPRRAARRGPCGRSRTGRGGPHRERVVTLLRAGHRGGAAGRAMVGGGPLILTTACVAWGSSLAPGARPPRSSRA
jgi:hypothetical protein